MEMIVGGAFQGKSTYARECHPGICWKNGADIGKEELMTAEGVFDFQEKKLNGVYSNSGLNTQKTSKCSGQKRNRFSKKVHSMNEKEEKVRDSWVNGEIKGVELKSFDFNTNDSEQV